MFSKKGGFKIRQKEILDLLGRESRWMSVKEISEKLNKSRGVISFSLKKLIEKRIIFKKPMRLINYSKRYVDMFKYYGY